MKKLLLALLMAVAVTAGAHAENYPYRSDCLWVTVPDHADWLYDTGEKAKIEVQFYKYGIPRDCQVHYEIADDMMEGDKIGAAELKDGRAVRDASELNPGDRLETRLQHGLVQSTVNTTEATE